METTILKKLQNNKKTPCVSVIVPTHKKSSERTVDKLEVTKAINKAKELVFSKYGKKGTGENIINELNTLTSNIDYVHNNQGIGFFASEDVSCVVEFPFEVKEKITVGNTFEIRDVLYLEETMINYYVLLINEKKVKLFLGNGENLKEVKDKNFPSNFYEEYEYERPSRGNSSGNSLKSTEKDKSIVKEMRLMANLKKTDGKLSPYTANNTPFVLCGNPKDLGYFLKVYKNHMNIAGKVSGNYVHENTTVLGKMTFKKLKSYLAKVQNELLEKLDEAIGKKLAVTGIRDVWKAAKAGKGLTLLVEKDYIRPGFVKKNSPELFMRPPVEEHEILTDAVDDVMEEVLAKNGKVVIFENDNLEKFEHVALILRY